MPEQKVALITGIGGQDGSYLAELLLKKGYLVRGIVRRASWPNTYRIDHLLEKYGYKLPEYESSESPFHISYADLSDVSSLRSVIEKVKPDEVYNLAAQSHVGISFGNGESTLNFNALGVYRLLEILRSLNYPVKYYQASSSEMFGVSPPPQSETTPFKPQSPYGIAKVTAFFLTQMYRNAYKMFASNGILFNHESPRRGLNFVTRKITRGVAEILVREREELILGNMDSKRDWGFAGEYVEAMWKILQHNMPDDFVISTGETHTIRDFAKEAFAIIDLNYEDFVDSSDRYKRPAEVPALLGDSTKAQKILGWKPKVKFKELAHMMLVSDIREKFESKGIIAKGNNDEKIYIDKAKELAKNL